MHIDEPMTTVTDLVLGFVTLGMGLVLSVPLLRVEGASAYLPWAIGFLATSAAAFLGAASHGLASRTTESQHNRLWFSTLVAIGLADVGLGCGAVLVLAPQPVASVLALALIVKLGVYIVAVWRKPEFRLAAYDYAITMTVLLVLATAGVVRGVPGSGWLAAGIVLGFVGAFVQRSGYSIHEHFNHNDLYHVIQLVAFLLVFRGALLLLEHSVPAL